MAIVPTGTIMAVQNRMLSIINEGEIASQQWTQKVNADSSNAVASENNRSVSVAELRASAAKIVLFHARRYDAPKTLEELVTYELDSAVSMGMSSETIGVFREAKAMIDSAVSNENDQ